MTSIAVRLLVAAAWVAAFAGRSYAAGAGMVEEPKPKSAVAAPTAEARYNQGEAHAAARNWKDGNYLGQNPASTRVRYRPVDAARHAQLIAAINGLPPQAR